MCKSSNGRNVIITKIEIKVLGKHEDYHVPKIEKIEPASKLI